MASSAAPMAMVSAHELLEVHDCTYRACANEAVGGSDRCAVHQREHDVALYQVTECPGRCGQVFRGTELRGRSWLDTHVKFCLRARKAMAAEAAPRAPAAEAAPSPSRPRDQFSKEALDEVREAIDRVLANQPEEVRPMPAIPVEDQDARLAEYAGKARLFHDQYGRWPLRSDAKDKLCEIPEHLNDKIPRGWQRLWDIVGAGKIPNGRAAVNYRLSGKHALAEGASLPVRAKPAPPARREGLVAEYVPSFAELARRFEEMEARAAQAIDDRDAAFDRLVEHRLFSSYIRNV